MRIAIGQINPSLGDFKNNREKILSFTKRALDKHCDLIVFPECSLFGYHPFDLLEHPHFVEKQLKELQVLKEKIPNHISALVGVIRFNKNLRGRPYYNSAALISRNKPLQFFDKELLPTGGVFDEGRFFEKGEMKNNFFELKGKRIFLSICEDIWAWPDEFDQSVYATNPIEALPKKGVDLAINMSASPYFPDKIKTRKRLVRMTGQHFFAPSIYVNLVGGQDELIFDGASFGIDANGRDVFNCLSFQEELNIYDLGKNEGGLWNINTLSHAEQLQQALVLGIRDFSNKTGLGQVHLGLSGGIDSALVACLAVDALGADSVTALALPGPYSAKESLTLAKQLAANLNIKLITIPITSTYKKMLSEINQVFGTKKLSNLHENLQARIRGMILMAYSNQNNSLLLATGNKSEYATGYSTLYGDMCGGLVPIGDLTKTQVYKVSEIYNKEQALIPNRIIARPPTAELRPHQKDQDTLPPYKDLDVAIDHLFGNLAEKPIRKNQSRKLDKWLLKKLITTEFKRWQAPPILKVSHNSFGKGRRWPIACK